MRAPIRSAAIWLLVGLLGGLLLSRLPLAHGQTTAAQQWVPIVKTTATEMLP